MADEENREDDTPSWVKELFGRLTDKVTEVENKIDTLAPPPAKEVIKPVENDKGDEPDNERSESKPKRKRGWIYR